MNGITTTENHNDPLLKHAKTFFPKDRKSITKVDSFGSNISYNLNSDVSTQLKTVDSSRMPRTSVITIQTVDDISYALAISNSAEKGNAVSFAGPNK